MRTLKTLNKEEVRKLLDTMSRKDICTKYNVSRSTLSRVIRSHGLTKKGYRPHKLNREQETEIRRLYFEESWLQKEIAAKFNVSQSMVARIVNKVTPGLNFGGEAEVKVSYKYNAN
jgi:DNA-binding transcriptional regulator LsrR (DeoR family)